MKQKNKIIPIQPNPINKEIGDIFYLPFGDTYVMNHYAIGYVYIKGIFGEPIKTFITPFNIINESIEYGCIVPDKIKVICVCGLEIEGRYLELNKIAEQINLITDERLCVNPLNF